MQSLNLECQRINQDSAIATSLGILVSLVRVNFMLICQSVPLLLIIVNFLQNCPPTWPCQREGEREEQWKWYWHHCILNQLHLDQEDQERCQPSFFFPSFVVGFPLPRPAWQPGEKVGTKRPSQKFGHRDRYTKECSRTYLLQSVEVKIIKIDAICHCQVSLSNQSQTIQTSTCTRFVRRLLWYVSS